MVVAAEGGHCIVFAPLFKRSQCPENLGQTEDLLDPCLLVTVPGNGQRSADIEEQIADLASSNAENTKVVDLVSRSGEQRIKDFVTDHYGYNANFMGPAAGVLVGFTMFFAFLFVFAINRFNFQKKLNGPNAQRKLPLASFVSGIFGANLSLVDRIWTKDVFFQRLIRRS
ncbi:hypothetical protein IFM89_038727 [Coptis chinensis]|uniref:Uncharacterized protein n=1 Tax=Coptis chinensis TaxID=261450 RepID=A0A835H061_9MAGN|nr:hypothetical protein IFM89_038727 [Coptis chinensis]